jgi:amidohydrolase family protein
MPAAFHPERIGADAIAGVTGDAPVYVSFFDYHSALGSRPVLALAGVEGPRRFAAGAAVVCDPAGRSGHRSRPGRRCPRSRAIRPRRRAWSGEERLSGRIAPGMRADLTALAADPVECPPGELPDVPVLSTVVDGEIVFRR